ncbi:hypothetical protein [Sorangium sp. So ce1099]|uniref:hypothetical protein n=1 Tax=Sorangium sp. So ce1099 TaxID=3133331 RepID=UPI003F5F6356
MSKNENSERVEQVRKRMLDTADALLQRVQNQDNNGLSAASVELYARSAATLFTAATRGYGDPEPDPG